MGPRSKSQVNKTTGLPNGITKTWRKRKGKRPYLEFQTYWKDATGKVRIQHFYVGVEPTPEKEILAFQNAKAFRDQYELANRAKST